VLARCIAVCRWAVKGLGVLYLELGALGRLYSGHAVVANSQQI
jgi:hypothetical protein